MRKKSFILELHKPFWRDSLDDCPNHWQEHLGEGKEVGLKQGHHLVAGLETGERYQSRRCLFYCAWLPDTLPSGQLSHDDADRFLA